ncbi:hypothetical protein [Mycobacterium sp.]|uniref:hypothetical protein n=1 Tax=Mycobacterium sp. TaxID=1785 RepID=UPI00122BF73B|nr:hypothetical protein [Mycobacterium sp.]TAM68138.1 MAG: hypothetical protein EPN51_12590 [Mycobacterium sp.]
MNRPTAPDYLVMPHTAQIVYTGIWAAVVLAFVVYAVVELVLRRSPLLLVLMAGGGVAYFNEPIDDLLGLVWHPRPGQWVMFDTFGPVPVWGLFVYIALFGGIPYLMLRAFERGVTRARMWLWIGVFWVADLAVEIPAINSGMYQYYGNPPMKVFGLPLYWFAINIGGPIETAVVLLVTGGFFAGWRLLLLLPIPMVLDAAGSVGMGWPIFSALHAGSNMTVKYLAAFATIAMAVAMLHLIIRYVAAKRSGAPEPVDRPATLAPVQH